MATTHESTRRLRWRLLLLGLLLAGLAGLAAAWAWTPLRGWLEVDRIVGALRHFGQAFGPLAALGGFALASTLAVPLIFLTLVTMVAFGPVTGFVTTLLGATLGSAVSYGIGRHLGREAVARLAGPRLNRVSAQMARRGVVAMAVIRLLPIAPFAIVNMVAGASQIRLRDFLLGSALGMTPATVAMMLFVDQAIMALKEPGPATLLFLALTVALLAAGLWCLRRWLRRIEAGRPE